MISHSFRPPAFSFSSASPASSSQNHEDRCTVRQRKKKVVLGSLEPFTASYELGVRPRQRKKKVVLRSLEPFTASYELGVPRYGHGKGRRSLEPFTASYELGVRPRQRKKVVLRSLEPFTASYKLGEWIDRSEFLRYRELKKTKRRNKINELNW